MAAVYLAALLFAAGNHYLQWGLVGGFGKKLLAAVMFVGVIVSVRFSPGLEREMQERLEARRKAEIEAELLRDKSNDDIEAKRLAQAIGVPPQQSSGQRDGS